MSAYGDGLATGEDLLGAASQAVEQARDALGDGPADLALVFVSGPEPEAALLRAGELSGAGAVLGCSASGVLGGARGVEDGSAVSVLLARLPVALKTFHLEVLDGSSVVGLPDVDEPGVAVLLADAWSFPVDGFVARAAQALPGLAFVGGVAHGASGPGSTRLLVDDRVTDRGAVGLLLPGTDAVPLVSQGCRPIGPAMTVTAARGNVLLGLAGQPAVEKVRALLSDLPPQEQALASQGMQIGIAVDEYADDHDYLVRAVLGTDPEGGGLVVGDLVEVGQTVRFQVRDAEAAGSDLRDALERAPDAGAAVVFSCTGRGSALFGDADHDPRLVRERLGALAGFFAGGEIGPVAGRSHLHTFTASMLLLP